MSRHEYILNAVEGVVRIPEAREGDAIEHVAMSAHDFPERAIPPGDAERYQLAVGKFLEVNAHDRLQ